MNVTSTELDIRSPAGDLHGKVRYARMLAEASLLPTQYRKAPANVLWAISYGDMLGLAPMAAITGIHVIEGKPSVSAALISALVRRAGHKLRVIGDDTQAQAFLTRSDDPGFTYKAVWTIERAKQANLLSKQNWRQYPAAMLKARAISEVARDACQEVLLGLYTPDELGFAGITDAEADDIGVMRTDQRVEHNDLRRMGEPDPGAVEKLATTPDDDLWYDNSTPAAQDGVVSEEPLPETPAPPANKPGLDKLTALFDQMQLDESEQDTVIAWLAPGEWTASAQQVRNVTKHLTDFLREASGDVAEARQALWSAYRRYNKMAGIDG